MGKQKRRAGKTRNPVARSLADPLFKPKVMGLRGLRDWRRQRKQGKAKGWSSPSLTPGGGGVPGSVFVANGGPDTAPW